MSKAKTGKELPSLKVEITIRPATVASRQAWQRFWERLLTQKVAPASSQESQYR